LSERGKLEQCLEISAHDQKLGAAVHGCAGVVGRRMLRAVVSRDKAGNAHLTDAACGYVDKILFDRNSAGRNLFRVDFVENAIQSLDPVELELALAADAQ
jgi:hypothetical protein